MRGQFAEEGGGFPSTKGKIFAERVQVCTVFPLQLVSRQKKHKIFFKGILLPD